MSGMKLCKYYSLDECGDREKIFSKLDDLMDDSKIEYSLMDDDDVIKIKNIGLTLKERKEIVAFFKDNDVIDYPDYEEYYIEDDEEESDEEEEDDDYDY